eukprot:CAMPEP_0117581430 /NCGR_PEP_ID=MMETSP0784-20121206/65819_1 /TAXON_ID=39447 /ORGANISM="" /LENGTH=81 /DNA_ID=CAMNT_0005381733 /DNA_START=350 /DNA_END=595 /DNA_ORIENTATION=-
MRSKNDNEPRVRRASASFSRSKVASSFEARDTERGVELALRLAMTAWMFAVMTGSMANARIGNAAPNTSLSWQQCPVPGLP